MSVMEDKSPTPTPSPQQITQQATNWHAYNMNMYNMNMYQNPYMYNPAYGAHNYYQYYGQRMQANWDAYRGFAPGTPMQPWGTPPQQQQTLPDQQLQQLQHQQQTTAELPQQTNETTPIQNEVANTELPPLPPGPPPSNPAPPGTQVPPPRPYLHSIPTTPIRFNMNTPRTRAPLAQNNPLGVRPQSKKNKKKKKKQHMQQVTSMEEDEEEDDSGDTPPLPASPPPPPPPLPPPPPVTAPPPVTQNHQTPTTPQVPGIKSTAEEINKWPPSLKQYVDKCYAKCVSKVDMDRVGVILKGKMMRATNDGTLWYKNWNEEPLPLLDSDVKPEGLNLGLNLKDKLNKMSNRLGPPQKGQETPQRQSEQQSSHKRSYRPSFKRNFTSGSSNSSSSDDESNSSSNKRRDSSKRSQSSWTSSKRHSSKKSSEKHLYKEYGTIGGGAGGPVRKEVLDKRAARFSSDNNSGRVKNGTQHSNPLYVIDSRPNPAYVPKTAWSNINYDPPKTENNCLPSSGDWEEDLHIVGTSTEIEKSYLRLTSAPDASQVRPPHILAKSLSMVKEKWAKEADYHYTCEQLKSIRQDLTVQGLRDSFTVEVYETHARIALEKGDHAEFNQCQSQLSQLHSSDSKNRGEFIAYRILYFIFTNEFLDLTTLMQSLSLEDMKEPCTKHALGMAVAWTSGVYSRLFKLFLTAPRMSPYLIEWFLNRERVKALKVIIKVYRPAVPVDLVRKELAFSSIGDTLEFVEKFGLVFTDNSRTKIDCKSSNAILAAV